MPVISPAGLQRVCLLFLGLGLAWRLLRYALQFPLWGDETFVCLNFLNRDYASLIGPLECAQVAPLVFLWSELTAYKLLGGSELAVRLFPLLVGLAALPLFARLAWRTVSPVAATLAVGFLALAYWPVAMSSTVKPYSLDLFMALLLLVPAVEWLNAPHQRRWLVLLGLISPLAMCSSYPAVCVAGAVTLAFWPTLWRRRSWSELSLFAVSTATWLATFVIHFRLVACRQLQHEAGRLEEYLQNYWADGFPPAGVWAFCRWCIEIHTGRMCAYPVGGSGGASSITTLLIVAGLWWFLSQPEGVCSEAARGLDGTIPTERRWGLRLLFLAPFGLNFLAAILHKYPYGGCCRLSQHLAPALCLLAGIGMAGFLERFAATASQRQRSLRLTFAVLSLIPLIGMLRDVARPYKDLQSRQVRDTIENLFEQAASDEPIVVMDRWEDVDPVHRWLLTRHADRVLWNGMLDARLAHRDKVWTVRFRIAPTNDPESFRFGQYSIMYADIRQAPVEKGRIVPVPTEVAERPGKPRA